MKSVNEPSRTRPITALMVILLGATALKGVLLALDAIPFNADEAVVALMARHIIAGEHTWFFYGQAYMGSLDAYLVAAAFNLMGESVLTIRMVQIALFVATLLTSYAVAKRFTGSPRTGLLTVLMLAFPPVLLTLYTTVSLGGYGETLLMGNVLLWLGHRLGEEDRNRGWAWAAWGLIAGLGFWAFGLILVYAVPVGLWLLYQSLPPNRVMPNTCRRRRPSAGHLSILKGVSATHVFRFTLLALGFALGSLPWWLGNLGHVRTGAAELLGTAVRSTATAGSFLGNVGARALNLLILGLPALFGLRFPWSASGPPLWLGVPALALYLGALGYGAWRALGPLKDKSQAASITPRSGLDRENRPRTSYRAGYALLWGIWAALLLGFLLTPFGGDPSGRYFLPLYLPLAVFTADALTCLQQRIGRWVWLLIAAVLAFNLVATAQAALNSPPGITTQFDPISQVDHRSYEELMAFLRGHGETRGYTNYWIAYPLAFLSKEEIVLVPRLPYKADLRYTPRDDRYAPYGEIVEASSEVVFVTSNHPTLDKRLREGLSDLGVAFREKEISSYRVFYDLSRKVEPAELSIHPEE